jgi:photosystem II stability/assembly factor-like uncharacterized protein
MLEPLNMKYIANDPQSPGILFAGSSSTLYKSTNSGIAWADIAPHTANIPTQSVSVKSSALLASPAGYPVVYRKPDGGSWSWLTPGTEAVTSTYRSTKIAFISASSSNVFATGFRDAGGGSTTVALWKSTNEGTAWSEITSLLPGGTGSAAGKFYGFNVDSRNTDYIYVFGKKNTNGTVFKTINGGDNWESVSPSSSTLPEVADLIIDPTGGSSYSNIIYAAVSNGATTENGIWKSVNGGSSWSQLQHSLVYQQPVSVLAINSDNPTVIYAAGGSTGSWWLRKSTDAGTTWSTLSGITSQITKILFHPTYTNDVSHFWIIADNGQKIYKTANGGQSFSEINTDGITKPIYDMQRYLSNNL